MEGEVIKKLPITEVTRNFVMGEDKKDIIVGAKNLLNLSQIHELWGPVDVSLQGRSSK
jgi:hypothetical protein